MYDVVIHSAKFKDVSTVKQHQLVYKCLEEHMKAMHGLRLKTDAQA